MSAIGDAILEKCLTFGDRIIKLNDYLLSRAVAAHESYKKSTYQKKRKETSSIFHQTSSIDVASIPLHLQSVAALCNQLLRSGTSIGANNFWSSERRMDFASIFPSRDRSQRS